MFSFFGGEGGEFSVLLGLGERGPGELQIRIFTLNSVNIFATHLTNRISKIKCVSTPSSLSNLVHCVESVVS